MVKPGKRYHDVRVNQRGLVKKILARYPGDFTVFRELLQNAEDAEASAAQICFQTPAYVAGVRGSNSSHNLDLKSLKVSRWIVRNDGKAFDKKDWKRLREIADGNTDETKIGSFGVGFYSVFGVSDQPVVQSAGVRMEFSFHQNMLQLTESHVLQDDQWTEIQMQLKQPALIPSPFDVVQYLASAMAFTEKMRKVEILLDDKRLAEIVVSDEKSNSLLFPSDFTRLSSRHMMSIESLARQRRKMEVSMSEIAFSAGSKYPTNIGSIEEEPDASTPSNEHRFWDRIMPGDRQSTTKPQPPQQRSSTTIVSAYYDLYSAEIVARPSADTKSAIIEATYKNPPSKFRFQISYAGSSEHEKRAVEEKNDPELGSVFRGPLGFFPDLRNLTSESPPQSRRGKCACRIFIGQGTVQTTGIGCHVSSRFIPTMERGLIDLANPHISEWNEELLYIGGVLARVVYESEMAMLQSRSLNAEENTADLVGSSASDEGLYIMSCFAFQGTTPDEKVGNFLKDAFFSCVQGNSFPILSTAGVVDVKRVRKPDPEFAEFLKSTPCIPEHILARGHPMITGLPARYKPSRYTFTDIIKELNSRVLEEKELIACIKWWVTTYSKDARQAKVERHLQEFIDACRLQKQDVTGKQLTLASIKRFVDTTTPGALLALRVDDHLPSDTMSIAFTDGLDPGRISLALRWQALTLVEWVQFLVVEIPQDESSLRSGQHHHWAERLLDLLLAKWTAMSDRQREGIKTVMGSKKCIPTKMGLMPPSSAFIPSANLPSSLPVIVLDTADLSDVHFEVLTALGVRHWNIDAFLEWLQQQKPESYPDNSQLVDYLLSIHSDPPEASVQKISQKIMLCWDCLFSVGRSTGLVTLIRLNFFLNWDFDKSRDVAFKYFSEHFSRFYEAQYLSQPSLASTRAFIPSVKGGSQSTATHAEIFSHREWGVLGFHCVHSSVSKELITKLKIREHPPFASILAALESNPPQDRPMAVQWFELLLLVSEESLESDIQRLSKLQFIPGKSGDAVIHFAPGDCFIVSGQTQSFYSRFFTFVDFGARANSFLRKCGTRDLPGCDDIAECIMRNPQEFLEGCGGHKSYIGELRVIARAYLDSSLSEAVRERIKESPMFLGFRSEHEGAKSSQLHRSKEIYIVDDVESYKAFIQHLCVSPQEDLLEKFYLAMGSVPVSKIVKYAIRPSEETPLTPQACELRSNILEKMPVFLHYYDDSRLSEALTRPWCPDRFVVRTYRNLAVSRTIQTAHVTQEAPVSISAGVRQGTANDTLELFIRQKDDSEESDFDLHDIATALSRFILQSYKAHDVMMLMALLNTPFDSLRDRGFDVDRIGSEHDRTAFSDIDPFEADKGADFGHAPVETTIERASLSDLPMIALAGYSDSEPPTVVEHVAREPGTIEPSPPAIDGTTHPKVKKRSRFIRWIADIVPLRTRAVAPTFTPVTTADIDVLISRVLQRSSDFAASGIDTHPHLLNQEHAAGGTQKKRDVGYCSSADWFGLTCEFSAKSHCLFGHKSLIVDRATETLPISPLRNFAKVVVSLAEVFKTDKRAFRILWAPDDEQLMGFNREGGIYLNLGYYQMKNHDSEPQKAYIAWYFIIAHELAHNNTLFHDENHALLCAGLSEKFLPQLMRLPEVRIED
ncbi:hypothetical protein HYDPIDRAFT_26953 [Hydnomerulius pinastri MD-312]|nr:hypothetical protein HYDPIDRAFT_26953 [Hydnomerulius pinastri MD-312]